MRDILPIGAERPSFEHRPAAIEADCQRKREITTLQNIFSKTAWTRIALDATGSYNMRLNRLIAAIGLSAALCATPVMSGSAFAVTRDHIVTFYFSDDTYTQHVGTEIQSCSGQVYQSGEITPYSQEMISTPCRPSPLEPTPPFLS